MESDSVFDIRLNKQLNVNTINTTDEDEMFSSSLPYDVPNETK